MVTDPELHDRLEEFERACVRAGVKVTHQRLEILREVCRSGQHPSAEAILEGVKSRLPSVALDTVYRTLWLLTDLGLVTTLGFRKDSARFDPNRKPHHHFICTHCHAVFDIETLDLSRLELAEHTKHLGTVSASHLEIHGVCSRCESLSGSEPEPVEKSYNEKARKQ